MLLCGFVWRVKTSPRGWFPQQEVPADLMFNLNRGVKETIGRDQCVWWKRHQRCYAPLNRNTHTHRAPYTYTKTGRAGQDNHTLIYVIGLACNQPRPLTLSSGRLQLRQERECVWVCVHVLSVCLCVFVRNRVCAREFGCRSLQSQYRPHTLCYACSVQHLFWLYIVQPK